MEAKYFLFSTDADRKLRHLSDSDFREVFCAVFNFLRDGVEPQFENYLLYDYYEKVLSTPYYFLGSYDASKRHRRSVSDSPQDIDDEKTIINCNGKAVNQARVENAILEHISRNPDKYRKGVSLPTLYGDMEYIHYDKERLSEAIERLSKKRKISIRKLNDVTFSITLMEAV